MKIILVNQNDNSIGVKEKLQVHIDGDLHRAFSVFIFNDKKQLLLKKDQTKNITHQIYGQTLVVVIQQKMKI